MDRSGSQAVHCYFYINTIMKYIQQNEIACYITFDCMTLIYLLLKNNFIKRFFHESTDYYHNSTTESSRTTLLSCQYHYQLVLETYD